MSNLKFTLDHEWIRASGTSVRVGVTHHAQEQLGDVVFVELPTIGAKLVKGQEAAVVESVKAASDLYAPVSGTVVAVNAALPDQPGLVNSDPLGEGWFFELTLSDAAELDGLLDEAGYQAHIGA